MSFFLFIILLILSFFTIAAVSFAPWVPTKKRDVIRALKLVNLLPNEIFYDLGCWDGRVTIEAARMWANAIGIELFPPLYFLCLIKKIFLKSSIKFKCANLFSENLQNADVIFVFGMPDVLKNKLREKLNHELKSGTRIISYCFAIDGWIPEKICKGKENKELSIFLYNKK